MYRTRSLTGILIAILLASALAPAVAGALSRDEILNRGKVWVNFTRIDSKTGKTVTGVPYSQGKWALENGSPVPAGTPSPSIAGYRTDCSGFASLCWNLRDSKGRPYSASTYEFGQNKSSNFKLQQIAKSDLQPGDMMLASAVWGATSPHAIIFAGWVDAAQTKFWAMEQTSSSSHNGTILHPRAYGQNYYRPFRLLGLEDEFVDCQERVIGANVYASAVAASQASYPGTSTVPALVVAGGSQWGDQITATALASAVGGPVLLTTKNGLPAETAAEIKRLKPARVFVIGSTSLVSGDVASAIGALGTSVVRVGGKNRYETSANIARATVTEARSAGKTVDTVYLATGAGPGDALAATPILSKTARPLMFVGKKSVSPAVMRALKASGVKRVIIVGAKSSVTKTVDRKLKKARYRVSRVGGKDTYRSSVAVARHAIALNVGLSWSRAGFSSSKSCGDALAWSSSRGPLGQVLLLTPTAKLNSGVRYEAALRRSEIGVARVFGPQWAFSQPARNTLARALRTGR